MKDNLCPIVGISCGDLNGIGVEIILKSLHDSRILEFFTPIIFANQELLLSQKKRFNIELSFNKIKMSQKPEQGRINVVNVWEDSFKLEFGKSTKKSGELSFRSLEAVTKSLKENNVDIMVTAPINKQNIQSDKFNFPGHTDYLSNQFQGESLMFMISEELKLGLLTDHISVKEIISNVSLEKIKSKITIMQKSLKIDFGISKPKIAVLSINPHAGDGGVIGKEDEEILSPALIEISKLGCLISGPFSSDSFFGAMLHKKYDAVLAIYHDQGLIPFKTLSFGEGVNFTAGLNKVRTSPDHGTGYDIAGKNIANPTSFTNAIFCGLKVFNNRNAHNNLIMKQS